MRKLFALAIVPLALFGGVAVYDLAKPTQAHADCASCG
jgi:hypothetical protein